MRFAELRCKTHYSFLRGASHPHEIIERAAELGISAVAITDRDGVYGIPKAYRAARELERSAGSRTVRLIVGAELALEKNLPRLSLLAANRQGYGLMCRMITASHEGKPKGKAALEWGRFLELAASSARKGLFAYPEEAVTAGPEYYGALRELFGERLYFPLSRVLDGHDRDRAQRAQALSAAHGSRVFASNDVHYHHPERRVVQDVLTSIREITPLDSAGKLLFPNSERHLKSPREMAELFRDMPEAIEATMEIAEHCSFSPSELRYRYPSEWIPPGESAQGYLERLVGEGARWRYSGTVPEDVRKQLEHELGLIRELQFADYFLTIWEIVQFAREKKILCQGRGSAANSAVCYCLGITAIDPVRMNLLFERFISVERGEPPDIDVDFEHERREEVIQHIYEKYGRDRAGMVAALITYRERSAVRDVAKALGVVTGNVKASKTPEDPRTLPLTEQIIAFPRHLSIHSGGFTLSADPIIETVPIEPARMEGRTIVQWDKEDLATIGLLKVDVLALGMLSALRRTFDLVRPTRPDLSIATIPAEDPKTYEMIRAGDTVGVFQIESRAQMSMLKRLLPENFYDLVIEVAIVRPGPIVGQMVHPYLKRRRGLESSRSPDPRLEPILSRTLGVPLFQEQVMKIAMQMAGFTAGEADELRRAIGAWRSAGTIERMGLKLKEGLLRNGLPAEFVERMFRQIQGFAEYGFPESHAASFALLAYASSYLKCHYPAEFTCALLNSQPMGFYSPHTLVEDAKRHGVRILPLDPNHSEWECSVEPGRVLRIGWCVVSGLGEEAGKRIGEARQRERFRSLGDFLARVRLGYQVLSRLAMADAFACFGLSQRDTFWMILSDRIMNRSSRPDRTGEQLSLFAGSAAPGGPGSRERLFRPLSDYEAIEADFESYGLSVRGHPMAALKKMFLEKGLKRLPPTTTSTAKRAPTGRTVRLAGLIIVRQRPPTAKGTAFATLEDEDGFADLIVQSGVYEKYHAVFTTASFMIVSAKVQRDKEAVSLLVTHLEPLQLPGEEPVAPRDLPVPAPAPVYYGEHPRKTPQLKASSRDFR